MPLPDYQITCINPYTGRVKRIFDGAALFDLIYNRPLNDVGALALTLPGDDPDLDEIFSTDTLIDVLRTSPVTGTLQVEETFFARLSHRFREGNEARFVVGGLSVNHLLARRIIDPVDDVSSVGGYSTKAGFADVVMRAYAREQMGDLASMVRRFPNFTVGEVYGIGSQVGRRARYDNLLQLFQDLALQGNMDFRIRRVIDHSLRLTIEPIGTDKTQATNYPFSPFVMFNPIRGNLSNPSLLIDRKEEGNVVYALGQGPGEFRITAIVQGQGVNDSPYNRIEFTQDVRLAERSDPLQLSTEAQRSLKENLPKREFTFEINGDAPGAAYNVDWIIGDRVTAAWEETAVDLRIKDVEISLSSDGERLSVVTEAL